MFVLLLKLTPYDFKISLKNIFKNLVTKGGMYEHMENSIRGKTNKTIKWNYENEKYDIISRASNQYGHIKKDH